MPTNPAETPEPGKPAKIGLSDDLPRGKIDRRISVARMMDWTDDAQTTLAIRCLRVYGNACLLYVSSAAGVFDETRVRFDSRQQAIKPQLGWSRVPARTHAHRSRSEGRGVDRGRNVVPSQDRGAA